MVGALCPTCTAELACAPYHVPGIVRSTVDPARAEAWLIDPWGQLHAIASGTTVGRVPGNDVVISDRHVSAEHAELRHVDDEWHVRDRGSTSGTHVRTQREVRSSLLAHLDQVQFGPLGFLLWARAEPPPVESMPVVKTLVERVPGYRIEGPGGEVLIVRARSGRDPDQENGILIVRRPDGDEEERLSLLQFKLLSTLCERRIRAGAARDTTAYLDTRELLSALWKSPRPQESAVRHVVRAVRNLLLARDVGIDPVTRQTTVIDSKTGLGYRLAWSVEYLPSHG